MEYRQDYKNSLREPSSRVPLLMAAYGAAAAVFPRASGGGSVVANLSSHVDVAPTLAELVGAPRLPGARGQSLLPFLRAQAPTPPRPNYVVSEYHSDKGSTGAFMIRQGDFKLITFGHAFPWFNASSFPDQLFNLAEDPFEMKNIAPANAPLAAQMFRTLEAELGGVGSVQRIDREAIGLDQKMWAQFIAAKYTPDEVVAKLQKTFRGCGTAQEVRAQVDLWLSLPSDA